MKDIYFDDIQMMDQLIQDGELFLLSGLGAGGKGLFAIDVTNPNSPTHLFAINNDETNKAVQHWGIDRMKNEFGYASGTIDPQYDYRN